MAYIVDGHNLLAQIPGLSLNRPSDRLRLVRTLSAFARARRRSITVWFDGAPPDGWAAESHLGRVRVRHSGSRRSADDAILESIRAARTPADLTVVTSDRALYERARHLGASAVHGHRFRETMAEAARRSGSADPGKPERPDPEEIAYYLEAFGAEGSGDACPDGGASRSRRRR